MKETILICIIGIKWKWKHIFKKPKLLYVSEGNESIYHYTCILLMLKYFLFDMPRDKVGGQFRIFNNEDFSDLYKSPSILRIMEWGVYDKDGWMDGQRWIFRGQTVRMGTGWNYLLTMTSGRLHYQWWWTFRFFYQNAGYVWVKDYSADYTVKLIPYTVHDYKHKARYSSLLTADLMD